MANKKILNSKLTMTSTENQLCPDPASNKIIIDIDSFKKKMNPKKKIPAVKKSTRKKVSQYKICDNDIKSFKMKFHPERFNNQENQPLRKTALKGSSKNTDYNKSNKNNIDSTSTEEHKCPHCVYSCHRERNLKIHIMTHQAKKPIQCPLCEYTCIQKFQLKAHILLHQTDAPFKCSLCEAKYKKEAGLKVHMLTHSNYYKFKCHDCQYLTNRFADYRRHLLIHSKAKPEKCPYCSYSCIRRSRLRAHMLVHRGENVLGGEDSILSRLGSKLIHCEQCDYICLTASRLKKHVKSHSLKNDSFALMLEKTVTLQDGVDQKQNSMLDTFPNSEPHQSLVENEKLSHSEFLVLAHSPDNHHLSVLNSSLKQEILLTSSDTHQLVFTQSQPDQEIFSADNGSLFLPPESQAVLLTTSYGHQESSAIVQNDQAILLSTFNPSWEGESDWPDADNFTVDQLSTFSFDHIIQPANNFIVTVVKEEQSSEQIKEEPMETAAARNHSKSKMFHCTLCSFSCDYKSTYKKHLRKHENQKNYKCAHCHYMCDELFRMKKHLISHTDQKVFHCDVCQFSCKSRQTLQQHMLAHSKGMKSGNCYQCPHCEYSCKSMPGFKSHLAKHTGDSHYQCNLCDERFMTEYLLKKHKFTHGVRPYQCQYCSYSCVQRQQMSTHMLQHTYEYPFCCQLCSAKYKKQDSLKIHMMSQHENKHKFNCHLCNYAGNRAADFREHMLTHSAQKPHQCPHCPYSCIRQTQLKKHLTIHEKEKNCETETKFSVSSKKTYRCAFCDFTCTRTPRLKAHLAKLHLNLPENLVFSFDSAPGQDGLQAQKDLT
ncbi:hypothetical protein Btru_018738 [Bulinus truncatus]|nr:hypothetical protein Btru_018738 [Bulinus truncatus]